MLSITLKSSPAFTIQPLSADQTKNSLIGAEVVLCSGLPRMISPLDLTHEDISTLRQALYDYSVLVIRKQNGIEPSVLPQLARIWDEDIVDMHSGGAKAVTDPRTFWAGIRLSEPRAVLICHSDREWALQRIFGLWWTKSGSCRECLPEGDDKLLMKCRTIPNFTVCPWAKKKLRADKRDSTGGTWSCLVTRLFLEGLLWFMEWRFPKPQTRKWSSRMGLSCELLPVPLLVSVMHYTRISLTVNKVVSGALAFSLLSTEEQSFALNTTIQYAPRRTNG